MTASDFPLEPIRRAITPEKYQAWHRMIHPYYTKQPSNVVGHYVRHYCPEGGLVADPFSGTGVTAIEALTNKRRALAIDLDPQAAFITRMSCLSPVDLNAYWDAYSRIERQMKRIVEFVRNAPPHELEAYAISEWYPKGVKLPSNADRAYIEDLYTKGNLILLAHLRAMILKVPDETTRNLLLFAFSSSLDKASIMYRYSKTDTGVRGDSGIFIVHRYWVPAQPTHRDAWNVFRVRARLLANAKKKSNALLGNFAREGDTFRVYCDSAEDLLKYTGENTVDYIYTDPPYGAHIAYLDLSTLWHAWLGFTVTDAMRQREAIEGGGTNVR